MTEAKKDGRPGVLKVLGEKDKMFYDSEDIRKKLSVSRSKAFAIIKMLQEELKAEGYLCVPGKISRKYFDEVYMFLLNDAEVKHLRAVRLRNMEQAEENKKTRKKKASA